MTEPVLRFERFELQRAERRLLRDGEEVPLRSRTFDLLVVLAERAGRLVTKDELLDLVWPGLVVEENNVAAQVAALRKALASELIVTVPGRGYRFAGRPQTGVAAEPPVAPPVAPPVPARPKLFGRDADLVRLRHALERPGCVSLVGPGGVGKTALATSIASESRDSAAAVWVDLSALSGGEQLLPALCRALGLEPGEADAFAAVQRALSEVPRLLVLDNAEHLVDDVARLVPLLLAAAPALHLLVTSQLPLAIGGERVERIDPLDLPPADASEAQALQSGALAMFVDRVRAADPRFQFAPASFALARRLCAELDGLPLALEMAAARVPLLGLQKVHDALAERFAMLRQAQRDRPARHRTLQAALDWSHDLLDVEEQRLFHALGVFAGGFTLDLAVEVAGADADRWDTIDRIAVLVDRSLVQGNHNDPPRYALLETMRGYALKRLAADGTEDVVRARHAAALLAMFVRGFDAPRDAEGLQLRALAIDEMHNLREAIAWARRHDTPRSVDLAVYGTGLAAFTPWRHDAADWLAACEPVLPALPLRKQGWWWRHHATQLLFRGSARAVPAARRAIECWREVGEDDENLMVSMVALVRAALALAPDVNVDETVDELRTLVAAHPHWSPAGRAAALGTLAHVAERRGDLETALAQHEETLAIARMHQLHASIDGAEVVIGRILGRLGRHDEAVNRMRAHLATTAGRDSFNVVNLRASIVEVLLAAGRGEEALAEMPVVLREGRRHGMPQVTELAALAAILTARPRSAALLLGHAQRVYERSGSEIDRSEGAPYADADRRIGAAFGPAELERLLGQGAAMDEAEADRVLFADQDTAASD